MDGVETLGQMTMNAVLARPENCIEKLGNRYEDTMQDPITGDFHALGI